MCKRESHKAHFKSFCMESCEKCSPSFRTHSTALMLLCYSIEPATSTLSIGTQTLPPPLPHHLLFKPLSTSDSETQQWMVNIIILFYDPKTKQTNIYNWDNNNFLPTPSPDPTASSISLRSNIDLLAGGQGRGSSDA